jgi:RNA polymerase sigma factor (sigma-70 family)
MNPDRTLEVRHTDEPSHVEEIADPETRFDGGSAPGRTHGRRLFDSTWRRRMTRRPSAAECAHSARRLSASEERTLAERGKAGDVDALQQLITANLGLVLGAVSDYKQCGVLLDDLIQEGNLGLIRAARHFDPSTHTARFATYATYWIRCFIVRALASNGSLIQRSKHSHLLRLQYRKAVDELRARGVGASGEPGPKSPSLDDVAMYLGVPSRRLEEARLTQEDQAVCQSLGDLTLADDAAPDHALVSNEDRAMVSAALRRLSPFEAWVICERFGLGEQPGRGIPGTSPRRDQQKETEKIATLAGPSGIAAIRGTRASESYFLRSYIDMGRDCGLSVFRLRQVEQTALDKLRRFLGQRVTEPT